MTGGVGVAIERHVAGHHPLDISGKAVGETVEATEEAEREGVVAEQAAAGDTGPVEPAVPEGAPEAPVGELQIPPPKVPRRAGAGLRSPSQSLERSQSPAGSHQGAATSSTQAGAKPKAKPKAGGMRNLQALMRRS
jgi:hypothetical protein